VDDEPLKELMIAHPATGGGKKKLHVLKVDMGFLGEGRIGRDNIARSRYSRHVVGVFL
jgi:hypothetical protein